MGLRNEPPAAADREVATRWLAGQPPRVACVSSAVVPLRATVAIFTLGGSVVVTRTV